TSELLLKAERELKRERLKEIEKEQNERARIQKMILGPASNDPTFFFRWPEMNPNAYTGDFMPPPSEGPFDPTPEEDIEPGLATGNVFTDILTHFAPQTGQFVGPRVIVGPVTPLDNEN